MGERTQAERDLEYLIERVRELCDSIDGPTHHHKRLDAITSWPTGANGPVAIAAYESLARDVKRALFMFRAACARVGTALPLELGPEEAARLSEIVERRTPQSDLSSTDAPREPFVSSAAPEEPDGRGGLLTSEGEGT